MYVLESERVKEKQINMSEKIGSREKEQFIKRKAIKTSVKKERKKEAFFLTPLPLNRIFFIILINFNGFIILC